MWKEFCDPELETSQIECSSQKVAMLHIKVSHHGLFELMFGSPAGRFLTDWHHFHGKQVAHDPQ